MAIDISGLNNIHLDVLKEIGNIGSGNAATALSKMINKKVDMKVPRVNIVEFKEVSDMLGSAEEEVVGIFLSVEGDLNGDIMFILKKDAAEFLLQYLLGYNLAEKHVFNDMELSALKEVGNILAGSYISALATLTKLNIVPSVPDIAIDMAGAIISVPAIEFGKVGDSILYVETEFLDGFTRVVGDFFLVPDLESYDILLKALGVIS